MQYELCDSNFIQPNPTQSKSYLKAVQQTLPDQINLVLQVWFQNRRAKYRKKENTKKGPGRPAHNAHPQSCSGEPISVEELQRKDIDRRQKKLYKQLEKQQKKLAAKGIHVDMESLRKDYETQRAGGKSTLNLEAALAAAGASHEDVIDVVGGIDDSLDENDHDETTQLRQMEADIKKKLSPFSIESLLAKRQLSVQAAAVAAVANSLKAERHENEENNNPPMVSPIPTSCSSPLSRASMTSPPPSGQYLSPSPSPSNHATSSAPPQLHFPIPLFPSMASMASMASTGLGHPSTSTTMANINQELSLLKPLTAGGGLAKASTMFSTAFLNKFDPSKISFSSTLASLQPEPLSLGAASDSEDEDAGIPARSSTPLTFGDRETGDQSTISEAPPASTSAPTAPLARSPPSATSPPSPMT